jgi:hypothetical protein
MIDLDELERRLEQPKPIPNREYVSLWLLLQLRKITPELRAARERIATLESQRDALASEEKRNHHWQEQFALLTGYYDQGDYTPIHAAPWETLYDVIKSWKPPAQELQDERDDAMVDKYEAEEALTSARERIATLEGLLMAHGIEEGP